MSGRAIRLAVHFAAGLLFAVGLGISGMTQPTKVVGFLDVFGSWDPSLAFVMLGGIGTHMVAYGIMRRRASPVLAGAFVVPTRRDITGPLVGGAALFGVGWAMAGLCPGPAIVSAGAGTPNGLLFVLAMAVGVAAFRGLQGWLPASTSEEAAEGAAAG